MAALVKLDWYIEVVKRIAKYQQHSRIAESLKEDIGDLQPRVTSEHSFTPKRSGLRDDTVSSMGEHIDKEVDYRYHEREIFLIDAAIKTLPLEQQFIIRKRFIEGKKDSQVIKLLTKNDFGICSADWYRKNREKAVEKIAWLLDDHRIEAR